MLKLCFALCPLLLAFSALAQEKSASKEAPAKPTENSAATGAQAGEARAKTEIEPAQLPILPLNFQDALKKLKGKASELCSVPLLEVPIPSGANFTLRQATPDLKQLAPMPQGSGPAPPCASASLGNVRR